MPSFRIVTVHCSPNWKLTFGVITYVLKLAECAMVASLCKQVLAHEMLYMGPATSTGSVKVIVILASCGMLNPFELGSVVSTFGPSSTIGAVRRGFGGPVTKSLPLLF